MTTSAISIIRTSDGVTFTFDVVEWYTLTSSVDVTEHPVERGTNIADHAQVKPKVLGFAGIVSETPFDFVDTAGGPDRIRRALDFLDSIAGQTATVVCEVFGTYENMAITRYPARRGKLRKIDVDVEFKQVRIAEAGLITISPSAPAVDTAAAANFPDAQDVGEQPTKAATSSTQDSANKSLLLELLESVGEAP